VTSLLELKQLPTQNPYIKGSDVHWNIVLPGEISLQNLAALGYNGDNFSGSKERSPRHVNSIY
jgi:hypothetical protein